MKPRVLVTMNRGPLPCGQAAYSVREQHLTALRGAGLQPILVPGCDELELDSLLADCQAVYLPGGDYVPERRDQSASESAAGAERIGLSWDRTKVEADLHLLRRAWEAQIPTLAICGGFQAMVLHSGGELRPCTTQELELHADQPEAEAIAMDSKALVQRLLGKSLAINSFHRQTVRRVGANLVASASSPDGLAEAVEAHSSSHRFWLGFQWHPELLGSSRPYEALRAAAN